MNRERNILRACLTAVCVAFALLWYIYLEGLNSKLELTLREQRARAGLLREIIARMNHDCPLDPRARSSEIP